MNIVHNAIKQAVKEKGQNELLAHAIIAWFSELANGNESIGDTETVKRRLHLLLQKTTIDSIEQASMVAEKGEMYEY